MFYDFSDRTYYIVQSVLAICFAASVGYVVQLTLSPPQRPQPKIQVIVNGDFECVSVSTAKEWTCARINRPGADTP